MARSRIPAEVPRGFLMLINNIRAALLAFLVLPAGNGFAFDGNLTPGEAFRMGYKSYKAGDTETAIEALNFAAEQGHTAALWKLGRIHASGDGVEQNDSKAFEIYVRIASAGAETLPHSRDAPYVSDALVSLGLYYEAGIADRLEANPAAARQIFAHAAAYFGDANAQFELARLHLDGIGGDANSRQAARWYKLAARKDHAGAQAQLGMLLLKGEGMRRNSVKGLMWLALARRQAADNANIVSLHREAFSSAEEDERKTAIVLADKWIEKRVKR